MATQNEAKADVSNAGRCTLQPLNTHTLELLPLEMQREVFEHLPPQDVKSMRLLNHYMHDISSPFLMQRVYFALRPKTMDIFEKISMHPIFSNTVKEIVFDCSLFGDQHYQCRCPKGVQLCICNRNKCTENCTTYPGEPNLFGNGVREHRNLRAFQDRTLRRINEGVTFLRRATVSFRNLHSLIISDWQTIDAASPRPARPHAVYGPRHETTMVPHTNRAGDSRSWYILRGPMKWDVRHACFPETIGMKKERTTTFVHLIQSFCEAFRNGQSPIERVHAMLMGWKPSPTAKPVPCSVFFPRKVSRRLSEDSLQFSRVLRSLKIHFDPIAAEFTDGYKGDLEAFRQAIGSMQNLEELFLTSFFKLPPRDSIELQRISQYSFVIKDIHWPHLRSMSLTGVWLARPSTLLDFLSCHGVTLKRLYLHGFVLCETQEETWVGVAERMHTLLPSLEGCVLQDLAEFGQSSLHLNYLPEDNNPSKPRRDCEYRQKHLDVLQRYIVWGAEGADPGQMQEARENWDSYAEMDRGPTLRDLHWARVCALRAPVNASE